MKKLNICSGMNLSAAIDVAKQLGCTVQNLRRTGELIFRHPMIPTTVRINGRRKDCPREATSFLREVASLQREFPEQEMNIAKQEKMPPKQGCK